MTRKDYQLIARTINEAQVSDETYRLSLAKEFAYALGREHSNFDRDRFIAAATATA